MQNTRLMFQNFQEKKLDFESVLRQVRLNRFSLRSQKEDLRTNKKASGRYKDLDDLEHL